MAKVLSFPRSTAQPTVESPFDRAINKMEKRFGVPIEDYMGINGMRTSQTQAAINRALHKELLKTGNKINS